MTQILKVSHPRGSLPDDIKISTCRSCEAPIIWAQTPNGRRCPIDAAPVPDGAYVIDAWNVKGAVAPVVLGRYEQPPHPFSPGAGLIYGLPVCLDCRETDDKGKHGEPQEGEPQQPESRFQSHFRSCVNAAQHSKRGRT